MKVKCEVKKQFKTTDGSWKKPGDTVSLTETSAKRLFAYGFVGKPPETAAIEPPERAVKESPKNKKKGQSSPGQAPSDEQIIKVVTKAIRTRQIPMNVKAG